MQNFKDNVVIVTGASSGIGREVALQLADQGARLALAARNGAELEETAAGCRGRGGMAVAVPTDVTDQTQCARLIEQAVAVYGRVDTLINDAGTSVVSRFDELQDLAPFDRIMRVNYLGSVYCTYYALPRLKETRGRIVGISSASGKWGLPRVSGYSASKHAMAGFFDSLRIELLDTGVSVTMVYPSFVATRGRQPGPNIMPVEACARAIVKAAAQRKREIILPASTGIALWLHLIIPGAFDRYAKRVMERLDI